MSPSIHIEEAFVPNDTSSASNFGMLSSANFSTDSLNDTTEPFVDYYNNSNSNNGSPRRYSNSSLTNSPRIGRANSNSATSRSRPLSAFLMDSSNAISEDGQPIQPVFNNTPRSRNSLTFGIKHRFLQHSQIIILHLHWLHQLVLIDLHLQQGSHHH